MNALLRPAGLPPARPMVVADLDVVMPVETSAYSHPWTRGNFIDSLAAGYRTLLQCDTEGGVLAYSVALPGFEETHLLNLTVAPVHQGQGLGSALLAELAAQAERAGVRKLIAVIGDSANAGSIGVHRALGFQPVGVLASCGWKFDRWLDVVLMEKSLGPGDTCAPQ